MFIPFSDRNRSTQIESADVLKALNPIWLSKPETARRVLQRIRTVFDWAKASGHRSGDNPVDGVSKVLPKQNAVGLVQLIQRAIGYNCSESYSTRKTANGRRRKDRGIKDYIHMGAIVCKDTSARFHTSSHLFTDAKTIFRTALNRSWGLSKKMPNCNSLH
jgi:hypothetical protein